MTERCVFELGPKGLALIEVAPGIDIERDVLDQMGFRPRLDDIAKMDQRIFTDEPMDLKVDLLHLDLADRIALDTTGNRLFINFEKFRIRSETDVEQIRSLRCKIPAPPWRARVDVIVNYDGARIDEEIEDSYARMVKQLEERFYRTVTRYSGSAFMRLKLDRTLHHKRPIHIFETAEEARAFLDQTDHPVVPRYVAISQAWSCQT